MNATERVITQLRGVRKIRDGVYRANCPACGGDSSTKFSVKQTDSGVVVHCFAGCELKAILDALGMRSSAELFDSVRTKPKPETKEERKARAMENLDRWAAKNLIHICEFLRANDEAIRFYANILAMCEDGRLKLQPETRERFWDSLAKAYKLRNDYEWQFEILNGRDQRAKLALWREACK